MLKYADDIALYAVMDPVEDAINILEDAVESLSQYLERRNLLLAPEKCKFVVFSKSYLKAHKFYIYVNGTIVHSSPSAVFLGMTLDYSLQWKEHIFSLIKKCDMGLRIMGCLCGTWWGADPCTLLLLYRALICSRIEYGGFLFVNCAENG